MVKKTHGPVSIRDRGLGEEDTHGVGTGPNTTLLSDTLQSIGLAESGEKEWSM